MLKVAILLAVAVAAVHSAPISGSLKKSLASKGSVDILVTLKASTSAVLNNLAVESLLRPDRLNAVAHSLQAHAQVTQKSLLQFLAGVEGIKVKSLWISNQVFVKNVNAALLAKLASRSDVSEIQENEIIPLEAPIDLKKVDSIRRENEWGVKMVGAPEVWAAGNNGSGIIVANIDTGVRYTHEALTNNYIGEYGWFDPYQGRDEPEDVDGHGTHTIGTIAGSHGVGVAPGAKWMACLGCESNGCGIAELLECGQFVTCPTLADGSNPDCSKAPHIVSNSWGGGGGQSFYNPVVQTWNKAGILPVFSNGNSGIFGCGSVGSPADTPSSVGNVFGVGSTTESETLSSFSSRGPSDYDGVKPEIAAPGSAVVSSYKHADDSYYSASGTSMAAPHVSGVLALILNAHPGATFEEAAAILYKGATHTVKTSGTQCGGIPHDVYPNNYVGHGRASASESLL